MPRAEHNLIQAPEVLRRLFTRLGIRQSHVAPTLNEGVQAVVILDDVRVADREQLATPERFSDVSGQTPDPLNVMSVVLANNGINAATGEFVPDRAQTLMRVRRMIFDNQLIAGSLAYGATYGFRVGSPPAPVVFRNSRSLRRTNSEKPSGDGSNARGAQPGEQYGLSKCTIANYVDTVGLAPGPAFVLGRVQVAPNATVIVEWPREDAPVLLFGWSWCVKQSTTNSDIDLTLEWEEEPVRT